MDLFDLEQSDEANGICKYSPKGKKVMSLVVEFPKQYQPPWDASLVGEDNGPFYSWDDPVWKAEPTLDECTNFWNGVFSDVIEECIKEGDGEMFDCRHKQDHTIELKTFYLTYIGSSEFYEHCDLLGMDADYILNELKEHKGYE